MKGWEIFMHSVQLVFSNLQEAFKISAVPYAISAVAYIFLGSKLFSKLESTAPNQLMQEAQSISFGFFVYGVIAMSTFLWIAVSWHRYILLGEKPTGWVPAFHGSEIVNYFIKGILLFLLIFVVIFVVSLVLALLLFWMGPAGALFVGLIAAGVSYTMCSIGFARFCPLRLLGVR